MLDDFRDERVDGKAQSSSIRLYRL
jgi:hypothetical protein